MILVTYILQLIIFILSPGALFYIFLDYHKKANVYKAIQFILMVILACVLLYWLRLNLGFRLLWLLPFFAALPFLILVLTKQKKD